MQNKRFPKDCPKDCVNYHGYNNSYECYCSLLQIDSETLDNTTPVFCPLRPYLNICVRTAERRDELMRQGILVLVGIPDAEGPPGEPSMNLKDRKD